MAKSINSENILKNITDYNVISQEKADFILENCKEYLLHTINDFAKLQNKVVLLLGFLIFFVSFLISNLLNCFNQNYYINDTQIFSIILIIFYSLIAIYLAMYGLYPKQSAISGNEPKNLLEQEFVEQEIRFMKIGETIHYQEFINDNSNRNEKLAKIIRNSLICVVISPFISFSIFFFFSFF